jgi:methyl-accepting chemotaxis protein
MIGTSVKRTAAGRLRGLHRRFAVQLVASMLLVSVPLMVVLAWVLTREATLGLTASSEAQGGSVARGVALRLEDWQAERRADMKLLATHSSDRLSSPATTELLTSVDKANDSFARIDVVDLHGKVTASSQSDAISDVAGQTWFRDALAGKPVLTSLARKGDHLEWIIAQPVMGGGGRVQGVVVGELSSSVLPTLLNPELDAGTELVVVDAQHELLFDSATMGKAAGDAAFLAAGMLSQRIDNAAIDRATEKGDYGSVEFSQDGRNLVGGFDPVDDLNWIIVVQQTRDSVLAPVARQQRAAILIVALGALLAAAVSTGLAWRSTRPIRRLTDVAKQVAEGDLEASVEPQGSRELVTLGESFNEMIRTCHRLIRQVTEAGVEVNSAAAELSASSDELAATTTQQSAAVTQVTATTEELARSSAVIADTVDDVARQTAETRTNLVQAELDIAESSERTLALAGSVNNIDQLLELINNIADQTNLLALNAAIEAARAGENGLGFAVVADEVRRLADDSKKSAREIAKIVASVQGETNATVMAMEKGTKQMQRGLVLLDQVNGANSQVRLTTQQQRSATAQVVETMEQLTDASRQVSSTALQIAAAAGSLSDLAGTLEQSGAASSNGHR